MGLYRSIWACGMDDNIMAMDIQQTLFDNNYSIGDEVIVSLPGGSHHGKIFAIFKNYAWSNETRYEVHGEKFITITSARSMKRHV